MEEPIVQYKNIRKSFGDVEVLKGINLDIMPGEKVALIGPSGSGKTTIIRLLMTLEQPTGGIIEVNGENLWLMQNKKNELVEADDKHLRKIRGDIGMVFQHFNLFPHMTILENCMLAPTIVKKKDKADVKKTALEMLDKVGLSDKVDLYPSQLSGGQKQRVAMARALMMRPKVMLFDEVTSALDPELVGEVLEVIRDLAKAGDMAMILVTHEMDFALDIADRVLFLNEGTIEEEGHPTEILVNPKSERLKDFLTRFTNSR
ncbi:ectoine/hydroxyectoine ABC transporter ATP-binding protein EhuA [Sporosarcina luteola]|uniref:Ectoine/hydroxyectoine ABC transporter ATP-binding protein EhuA n=1 Tax=Sporosarcina luteola TaxID=582850 RepID=A0A511Z5A0_9BACL|nr:ectoine/hydroxyectoine ABC transporter ATP-binding protein EhuA [Sporosarcina luteola]GEN82621.1 ectoine/hydroxyectoine ABC transporter ATP-binding protein EhuA [Sporosarcina luteola]